MKKIIAAIFLAAIALPQGVSAQTLDNSFGTNGIVVQQTLGPIKAMAMQADGKIVTAGAAHNNSVYHFQVARYNSDGSLDNSFGNNGAVYTEISFISEASCLVIQPDGKIVVAGTYYTGDFVNIYHAAIVRYKTNGDLDSSFGTNGIVMAELDFSESVSDVVLQSDGKIVIGGGIATISQIAVKQFMLARYTASGTLDNTFGTNGVARATITPYSEIKDIALQADGKIVAGGQQGTPSPIGFPDDINFAVARFDAQGILDPNFGNGGTVVTNVAIATSDVISAIALQADGKILAAGNWLDTVAMVRYNADGTLDQSFGTNGKAVHSGYPTPLKMITAADGKIITASTVPYDIEDGGDFITTRYLANGSIDNSFGTNGAIITNLGGTRTDFAHNLFLQPDGKLVVGGSSNDGAAMVRYSIDGGTSTGDIDVAELQFTTYPNPFSSDIFVNWEGSKKQMKVHIQLFNIIGRREHAEIVILQPGKNQLQLPVLASGNYILTITDEQGKTSNNKITKN